MGWASGSSLMRLIISQSRDSIKVENYVDLIDAFEEYDCDTLDECLGICNNFDIAYSRVHKNYS
jgi:hypothetical protein